MFAQIYNTAKRILSRSPSVQGRSSEARDTPPASSAHSLEVTMVTTRRGTETPGQDTPRSAAKGKVGKRELDALDTPIAAKRQKRSTPKQGKAGAVPEPAPVEDEAAQDSTEDTSDTITVAVPSEPPSAKEELLPIRRRSSPKVMVAKASPPVSTATEGGEEDHDEDAPTPTQETVYQTPDQKSESVYATPATKKRGDGSPTPRSKRANERTSARKTSARKRNTHVDVEQTAVEATPTELGLPDEIPSSTFESEQAPITSQDAWTTPSQSKEAHLRFGSEEPADTLQNLLQAPPGAQEHTESAQDLEDEDASDSDEAPEVVTTTAAASKAKASEQDAARALLAQEEQERQKREAREKRIAEEQAEKRKREEKKAKKLAKQLAKQAAEQPIEDEAPRSRISIDPTNLPDLLPTDLLSNLPDQRGPTPPPDERGKTEEQLRKEKLNRHIKFLERTDKGPKDIKKGKLSIAVLAQQNRVLPPKVSRESKDVREGWLQGRKVQSKKSKFSKSKVERRGFGNRGFIRGDD